jgi:hypothetical protein
VTSAEEQNTVFGYPLLIAEDFDHILAGTGVELPLDQFSDRIQEKGQAIIQARGGAGKTVTAERLAALEATHHGVAFVQALTMPPGLGDFGTKLDIDLLIGLSQDMRRADLLRERSEGLVIIDGINEIPKERADRILLSIPILSARHPFIRFVVTDRLTRRDIDQDVWLLGTLGPVPEKEVRERLDTPTEPLPDHLTVPYYLDRSIDQGGPDSQVAILREGLTIHGGVPEHVIGSLAGAVYDRYEKRYDRTIDAETITDAVGVDIYDRMLSSDALRRQGNGIQFAHHLMQDFLAALHLSTHDKLWYQPGFDVVTLKASSFDALALAAALIEPRQRVDDFVHRVFDWNYYGAAYILEEDASGEKRILEAMRTAILAMLAEKRFDRMVVTAHRVEDALRLQNDVLASRLLRADNRDEVVQIVESALPQGWETQWPEWFHDWYETFKRPSKAQATEGDVANITSPTGTVGWATSNMLKRLRTPEDLRQIVRGHAATHGSPTVRWRAVHTLGAWPSEDSVDVLLSRVEDSDEELWVRYGALRSLLEVAAGSGRPIRRRVFTALGNADLARKIASSQPLRKEAIRALEVADMPDDWHALAGDFLDYLWADSDDPLDRDEVLLLAQRLRS